MNEFTSILSIIGESIGVVVFLCAVINSMVIKPLQKSIDGLSDQIGNLNKKLENSEERVDEMEDKVLVLENELKFIKQQLEDIKANTQKLAEKVVEEHGAL